MIKLIDEKDLVLIVIDLQEKLLKIISDKEKLIINNKMLIRFLSGIETPIIATKQVKLGDIIRDIAKELKSAKIIEKETFSCFRNKDFMDTIRMTNRKTLIITGIETHICVLQTAIDALNLGYRVIIPYDAVSSQIKSDHEYALQYLQSKGVEILPAESIIYAIMESSKHPLFKEALNLVKERRKLYV
ncbi:isochorismatase family protein [Staphylothermus hellenicus]|uniref:Isochorismatase hydrolase n=1 Tax=Staphylothermus hellenicus (strain DSM 12710 / JCM 10830 / BK20S6-10-b1 / P8) TaxID=591019 RepID=D7DC00_STAHD|nr:isochorismatase family protein [Staphylothermus hellenicus]ADI31697.1 isochorismatase hydrolase [Staphylothermus hellenicus DSM 12710]